MGASGGASQRLVAPEAVELTSTLSSETRSWRMVTGARKERRSTRKEARSTRGEREWYRWFILSVFGLGEGFDKGGEKPRDVKTKASSTSEGTGKVRTGRKEESERRTRWQRWSPLFSDFPSRPCPSAKGRPMLRKGGQACYGCCAAGRTAAKNPACQLTTYYTHHEASNKRRTREQAAPSPALSPALQRLLFQSPLLVHVHINRSG